jgi:hypothetical protein
LRKIFFYMKYCVYICKTKRQTQISKHSIKSKDMNKIRIAPEFKSQMAEEFKTSKQNIMMALKGYNHSELAKKVRTRAKQLLQEEANNVII